MDKHGLDEHVRWQTEVVAAEWDDEDGVWTITTREPDEGLSTMQARAVITAVGQLNRPHLPQLKGANTFAVRRFTPRRGTTRSMSPASASR